MLGFQPSCHSLFALSRQAPKQKKESTASKAKAFTPPFEPSIVVVTMHCLSPLSADTTICFLLLFYTSE
jgi:hypothetical protein